MSAVATIPYFPGIPGPTDVLNAAGAVMMAPVQSLQALFHDKVAVPGESRWEWDNIKITLLHVLEMLPDSCTILDSVNTLAKAYGQLLPTAFRVFFASVATFNILLVPLLAKELFGLLTQVVPKIGRGRVPGFDSPVKVSYLSTLLATVVAISAAGLKEFCELLDLPYDKLQWVMDTVFPWVPYLLRIIAIIQVIDLFGGCRFQAEMKVALEGRVNTGSSCVGKAVNNLVFKVGHLSPTVSYKDYLRARNVLDVVMERRFYVRRSNGFSRGLKYNVRKLQKGLDSYNPVTVYKSVNKALKLGKDLNTRSISYVRNQTFGLGANIFAFWGLVAAANVVAVAIISMFSAGYYMTQTSHSWNMEPPATIEAKPEDPDAWSWTRLVSPVFDLGSMVFG